MSSRRLISNLVALLVLVAVSAAPKRARAEFPTLERAVQLARERALIVAEAQAEVGMAHAQMKGARVSSIGNPYVDFQVEQAIGRGLDAQAIGYLYFPIDIPGQRGARIDEAEQLIKWREVGLADARGVATGEVVSAYGEMLLGVARSAQARDGERHARDEAKYFAGRLEAKDTTIYEKALADAEVARWVQSRAEAQLRLTSARARYAQLTGLVTVDAPAEGGSLAPPPLRGSWTDAHVTKLVDHSPLVARLMKERDYWDASIERYKAERMPPVALELIGGRGDLGEARIGGGALVTFPVTRRFQGEIARAETGRNNAASRLSLSRSIVETRFRAARDAVLAVEAAVKELDESGMPALERAVAASDESFKMGKIELTRVLLARRDLALARARRLDLLESAWRAYADLTILSGDLP